MALKLSQLNPYTGDTIESYSVIDDIEMDKAAKKASYTIKSFDSQEARETAKTNLEIKPFTTEVMEAVGFDELYQNSVDLNPYAAAYIDAKKTRPIEETVYAQNDLGEYEPVTNQVETNKWVNAQDC
jgi:hypothetical protein